MFPIGDDEHNGSHPADVPPRWNWGMLFPARQHSRCYRCRRPWWITTPRTVYHEPFRGQSALCVSCWRRSPLAVRRQAHWWACVQADTTELWPQLSAMIRVADDTDGFLCEPELNYLAMLAAGDDAHDLRQREQRLTRVRAQNPDCLVTPTPDATGGMLIIPRALLLDDAVQPA